MIRRTSYTNTLRMDTKVKAVQDWDFWLRLSECCQFLYLHEVIANYHVHDDMMTIQQNNLMRANRIIVQKYAIKRPRFQRFIIATKSTNLHPVRCQYCRCTIKYGRGTIFPTESPTCCPLSFYNLVLLI